MLIHASVSTSISLPLSLEVPRTSFTGIPEKGNSRGNRNTSRGDFYVAEKRDSHDSALPE